MVNYACSLLVQKFFGVGNELSLPPRGVGRGIYYLVTDKVSNLGLGCLLILTGLSFTFIHVKKIDW